MMSQLCTTYSPVCFLALPDDDLVRLLDRELGMFDDVQQGIYDDNNIGQWRSREWQGIQG